MTWCLCRALEGEGIDVSGVLWKAAVSARGRVLLGFVDGICCSNLLAVRWKAAKTALDAQFVTHVANCTYPLPACS